MTETDHRARIDWSFHIRALQGLAGVRGTRLAEDQVFRILTNQARSRAQREGRIIPFSSVFREENEPEPAILRIPVMVNADRSAAARGAKVIPPPMPEEPLRRFRDWKK